MTKNRFVAEINFFSGLNLYCVYDLKEHCIIHNNGRKNIKILSELSGILLHMSPSAAMLTLIIKEKDFETL